MTAIGMTKDAMFAIEILGWKYDQEDDTWCTGEISYWVDKFSGSISLDLAVEGLKRLLMSGRDVSIGAFQMHECVWTLELRIKENGKTRYGRGDSPDLRFAIMKACLIITNPELEWMV